MTVHNYMTNIIRKVVANQRGVNPIDVSLEEVLEIYKNDGLEKYRIRQTEITSFENEQEVHSVVCSLVDRVTGYEYYGNVIELKKENTKWVITH